VVGDVPGTGVERDALRGAGAGCWAGLFTWYGLGGGLLVVAAGPVGDAEEFCAGGVGESPECG